MKRLLEILRRWFADVDRGLTKVRERHNMGKF